MESAAPAMPTEELSTAVDSLMEMSRSSSLGRADRRTSPDIYGFHLQQKNLGHPLWKPGPEPDLPRYCRKRGVMLGDVGIITDQRGFSFLFNVCHSRSHPINSSMALPSDFEPFSQSLESCVTRKFIEQDALYWWYLADSSIARTDDGEEP